MLPSPKAFVSGSVDAFYFVLPTNLWEDAVVTEKLIGH